MDDIPVGAEICREKCTRVLQIGNAQLHRLACERHPRALPQQLDDATGDSGCQFHYGSRSGRRCWLFPSIQLPGLCKETRDETT
jgi:hypothetical protein